MVCVSAVLLLVNTVLQLHCQQASARWLSLGTLGDGTLTRMMYCIASYCTAFCLIMYCITSHCIAPPHTVLHCLILCCTLTPTFCCIAALCPAIVAATLPPSPAGPLSELAHRQRCSSDQPRRLRPTQ